MKHRLFAWILLLMVVFASSGQEGEIDPLSLDWIPEPELGTSNLRFIENQGQWEDPISYKVRLMGGNLFV